jgi:hypothetical protein
LCQLKRKHFETPKNRPLGNDRDDVMTTDPPRETRNIILKASEHTTAIVAAAV